jgi:hypothetical protein
MDLLISQSVSLGNDGYQIDFGMEAAHKFNVDGTKPFFLKKKSADWNGNRVGGLTNVLLVE